MTSSGSSSAASLTAQEDKCQILSMNGEPCMVYPSTIYRSRGHRNVCSCEMHVKEINRAHLLLYASLSEYQIARILSSPLMCRSTSREIRYMETYPSDTDSIDRVDAANDIEFISNHTVLNDKERDVLDSVIESLRTPKE